MSVAGLNKSRLGLNKSGKKKSRNTSKRRKAASSQSFSQFMSALVRKACISGVCLLLLAVIGVGCMAGYRWLTAHTYFALHDIKVTGNHRLTYGEILSIAEVGLNKNSLAINIGDVENRLSNNSWIKSATVKRQLPDKLQIHVREKKPYFMVRQHDKLFYCDSSGELITPVVPGKFSSLPFLNIESDAMDKAAILPEFMSILSRRELPFDPGQIAWIDIKGGNRMEIFMDGLGLKVLLSLDNWHEQLSHLNTVWNDLKNRGEFRNVATISTAKGRVWVEKRSSGNRSLQ
ncbi:cell division protein FtsQ/DivIB [Maridesulfovibrio hydrothermalis]|uniref:Polypeptide-transport-associated domain protein FtsQ-type n=1 Tax=Maridesulfovibrio hydrothermalis AM13 = DSM 14728 TaxID=1121451 RepID=L0R6Z2_9BACT|nr:FtsQ-type POTRA domain-containing protein [Maridesulfovibrio hydrothermalis]CCO22504.1 Polypeptide-transport-associated domain protein FtsQ-type [Maridesulfovibrio hydrothermalis AM13 = DSM 14728]